MKTIDESGLLFGPFPDDHCFYIERSATYTLVRDRVQMAEFLLLQFREARPLRVCIVEAKSSSPQPGNETNFAKFIDEIREKLTNGLALGIAARLNRHQTAQTELSEEFKGIDLATAEFRLVLVINGHKKGWLPPIQDKLIKSLHTLVKTWALGSKAVVVLNEESARRHGLIN